MKYELRILLVFLALLVAYLLVADVVLEPLGYYGTVEQPRFADPWIARAETIVRGGLLYRDVYTTTPPLINFLLIPPALVSSLFGHRNPWATLSFMTYFSLFNLFCAYGLLYLEKNREEGYRSALYFLFNPLTFGNSVLRRQDESILTFFFALALLFLLHRQHGRASVAVGLTLLVKFTGALIIPIALVHTRDWRYLVVPSLVLGLVFAPFLIAAGSWSLTKTATQNPFELDGISLGALWSQAHEGQLPVSPALYSAILVIGVAAVLGLIAWKPLGLLEDLALLTATMLLLAPKLHCGYFSLLALVLAPLVGRYRIGAPYFLFGLLAVVADMFKWPAQNYPLAFGLMVSVSLTLVATMAWIRWPRRTQEVAEGT